MSFPGGIQFTNSGFLLSSKTLIGKQVVFTRLAVGDGELGGQSPLELTGLIHEVESIDINKLQVMSDTEAVVGGPFTNQGLATGFWWREIGLYATDPDTLAEKLYCYGNAGALADYIPAGGGAEILEKQTDIWIMASSAANISAVIDSSLVYASAQDLADHMGDGAAHEATAVATAGKIMMRDGSGRAQVNDPATALDAVNKQTLEAAMALVVQKATNTAGTDAYTITLSGVTAYTDGLLVLLRTSVANTGAASLNINGLGAKPIRTFKAGADADISTGEIPANSQVLLCYSSSAVSGAGGFVSLNIRDADLLDGKHAIDFIQRHSCDVSVGNTYVNIATVVGLNLASQVRLRVTGTGDSVVVNAAIDIMVNHTGDILIRSLSTEYSQIYVKVGSDGNSNYNISIRTSAALPVPLKCAISADAAESVSMYANNPAILYAATTLEHLTKSGAQHLSATGGTSAEMVIQDNYVWHGGNLRTTNGYLEYLNGGTWTPVAAIKSVQRGNGTGTMSATPTVVNITISAVNTAKAVVDAWAAATANQTYPIDVVPRLTSSTNLELSFCGSMSLAYKYSWEVAEYN